MEEVLEFMVIKMIVPAVVVIMFLFIFVGLPCILVGAYQESKTPDLILKKNQWHCVATQEHMVTTYIMVGKVMIPNTVMTKECVQYGKHD